jgi:hypothetical protein
VREYSSAAGSESDWSLLGAGEDSHPFILADGSGSVLVEPAGASLELQSSTVIEVDPDESTPPQVAQFLAETPDIDPDHQQTRRYRESRLDPGDDVHVLGPVREVGSSFELPGAVDAVVGLENPDERGLTVGEDDLSLSAITDQIRADHAAFAVTNTDEAGAARRYLKQGALWFGVGLVFVAVPVWLVLV